MALALDTSTDGGLSSAATSKTYAHVNGSGSNRVLFVTIADTSGVDNISGVTYGGVAMQRLGFMRGNAGSIYVYVLRNQATGSNNVVITANSSSNIRSHAVSYTGGHQNFAFDAIASAENTGVSSGSWNGTSLTAADGNCWALLCSFKTNNTTSPSAGGGSTTRQSTNGLGTFDSNGVIGTSSYGMNAFASDGTQDYLHIEVAFRPDTGLNNLPNPVSTTLLNNGNGTVVVPSGLTNSMLVVGVGTHQGTISSVTYNGVALTKIDSGASAFNECGDLWVLLNPPAGSFTLAVSMSGGSWWGAVCTVVENVKQTTTVTHANANGSSSNPTVSITPPSGNCLLFACMGSEAQGSGGGGESGETAISSISGQSFENGGMEYARQVGTGAHTMDFGLSSGQRWGIAAMALEYQAAVVAVTKLFIGKNRPRPFAPGKPQFKSGIIREPYSAQ